jgi:predicted nucleic acid-binding protein
MSYAEIRDTLAVICALCTIQTVTIDTHELGWEIAERFGFSVYNSMIVSSALQSDCSVLYSEDMQHGQTIENQLLITNPFLD